MEFQKIENEKAIQLWNDLALSQSNSLTIAHNPYLFGFFLDFLKFSPFYFILYENEKSVGLLPMVNTGKSFISIPHFSYGGIHWLDAGSELKSNENSIIQNLLFQVVSGNLFAGFYGVQISSGTKEQSTPEKPIEIRNFKALFGSIKTNKVVHTISLKETQEEQTKTFSSNLRRKINKASKNKLLVKHGGIELLNDFSKVYDENMHRIGSPTLGIKFFQALLIIQETNAKVFVAYLNEKPVGGSFAMWYNGYYENTWFSTLADFNHLYPSYLLHDEMIRNAVNQKAHIYSMGRSTKNSGVHRYKLQWPVEEKELFFNTTQQPGFNLKDQKWLTKVWKRLPAGFVNRLGPIVAKRIY